MDCGRDQGATGKPELAEVPVASENLEAQLVTPSPFVHAVPKVAKVRSCPPMLTAVGGGRWAAALATRSERSQTHATIGTDSIWLLACQLARS